MIAFLTGQYRGSGPGDTVVLELGGVGLRVRVSTRVLSEVPAAGATLRLYTHLVVREDELSLYGFGREEEVQLFERLLGVSGLGPKGALGLLSALSAGEVVRAVEAEDLPTLTRAPGIGKKTAQRIVFELKGRLGGTYFSGGGAAMEAAAALQGLGLDPAEAATALAAVADAATAEEMVKGALRHLGQLRQRKEG